MKIHCFQRKGIEGTGPDNRKLRFYNQGTVPCRILTYLMATTKYILFQEYNVEYTEGTKAVSFSIHTQSTKRLFKADIEDFSQFDHIGSDSKKVLASVAKAAFEKASQLPSDQSSASEDPWNFTIQVSESCLTLCFILQRPFDSEAKWKIELSEQDVPFEKRISMILEDKDKLITELQERVHSLEAKPQQREAKCSQSLTQQFSTDQHSLELALEKGSWHITVSFMVKSTQGNTAWVYYNLTHGNTQLLPVSGHYVMGHAMNSYPIPVSLSCVSTLQEDGKVSFTMKQYQNSSYGSFVICAVPVNIEN